MAKLRLSFACALYDRMQPLYTGEVSPAGIDLNFIPIEEARPIFDRMSGGQEFDVAEYSSSEFVQRFANKQCPFVAIPVFPSRAFRHGFIAINKKSGIAKPKDLEGKRVGVPLYTMTAAIFIRGLLQHEFDVDFEKIHWVQGAVNHAGAHGNPTVLPLLKPVPIEVDPSGRSLSDLIEARVVDATLGTSLPEAIRTNPDIGRLFPNYVDMERDYYKRTGIYPIMHLVAIRRDIYERYPFVVEQPLRRLCRIQEDRAQAHVQPPRATLHDAVPDARHRRDPRNLQRRPLALRCREEPQDTRGPRHLSRRPASDRSARQGR